MSLQTESPDLNCNLDKAKTCESESHDDDDTETELECLGTQIGGHSSRLEKYKKTKLGIFDLKNGLILKTLFPPPRGPRELKFYQNVFCPDCNDLDILELRPFIPTFYGTEEKSNTTMMKLSNLTAPFKKPCVMDIKMGRVTYDQEATAEKIYYEEIKFPPLKKTGFQIVGMIIQNETEKKVIDKHYTRSLSEKTLVTEGIGAFFSILSAKTKKQVINGLVSRLKKLETWFLKQRKFSFTASSLLFIYEGKNGKAIVEPIESRDTDLVCDNFERTSSLDTKLPCESNDCSSIASVATRKRSHDHTTPGDDNCDDSNGCGLVSKISKGEGTTPMNPKEASSDKRSDDPVEDYRHDDNSEVIPECSVHLIDFAHVFPASDIDENVLFGLQNLISSLLLLAE